MSTSISARNPILTRISLSLFLSYVFFPCPLSASISLYLCLSHHVLSVSLCRAQDFSSHLLGPFISDSEIGSSERKKVIRSSFMNKMWFSSFVWLLFGRCFQRSYFSNGVRVDDRTKSCLCQFRLVTCFHPWTPRVQRDILWVDLLYRYIFNVTDRMLEVNGSCYSHRRAVAQVCTDGHAEPISRPARMIQAVQDFFKKNLAGPRKISSIRYM